MGSGNNQATTGINWDEWSRVVEAALDPRHRGAVQKFLAQADLSAEIAAALDEKLLAPRRSEGATGEQCANLLCNLGFASLVTGKRESAEFAMACGRLAEQLGPDSPDLALRRLFLFAKGSLVVAVLTQQPHVLWYDAAKRCVAYLRALDQHLVLLPADSVETNAMAAYSFAGQLLSRIHKVHAVEHYAGEISQLVEVTLALARKLPATIVSRVWKKVVPGVDAGILFRRIGAVAELHLQIDEASMEHAKRGLKYLSEILEQHEPSTPDLEEILQIRAKLLLASGRYAEACEQAEALEGSSDRSVRSHALVIKSRCNLNAGNPELAAESLAELAPTPDQALKSWRESCMGDTTDAYWTDQRDAFSATEDMQNIWRLQAVAAAELQDMPTFLETANRSSSFLVDSLNRDRQQWTNRKVKASRVTVVPTDRSIALPDSADLDPMAALDEIFTRLADGTALLQVIITEQGILTWDARMRGSEMCLRVAPNRPSAKRLTEARISWCRAYLGSLRRGTGTPEDEAEGVIAFTELVNEMTRIWGELLQRLVEDGITQLILIGDDLVDIPLHATRIVAGNEYLMDRMPVTYAPSLSALHACLRRTPKDGLPRKGVALRSLIDADLDPAGVEADSIAAILETKRRILNPAVNDAFWAEMSAAQALHIVARGSHDAGMVFDSVLGEGWLDLSISQLAGELDLAQCDIVSNLYCESALPSRLRAPGLDLAAIFLIAGARSVLASTWVTNHDLASAMAQQFFRRWVTGLAPSAAFREALLCLRSERPALADFHWAGMRLVGAP